jgi:flagellar export protein FliJ
MEILEAERRLSHSSMDLRVQEQQLHELQAGRAEYSQQLGAPPALTLTAANARTVLTFLQRLDEAISQLQAQLVQNRRINEHYREQWLKIRHKTRAMDDVAARFERIETQDRQRREQRELDDIARRAENS